MPENAKSKTIHLKLTVIDVAEEQLLLRHKKLLLLDLPKCWMFMLEDNWNWTRVKRWWGKAIETFVAPKRSSRCKSIAKDNLHSGIEATSQQCHFCSPSDRPFGRD